MYTVYMHTDPEGKRYIGLTSVPVKTRWLGGRGYDSQKRFAVAIKKYGWNNIKHEILATSEVLSDARDIERKYIATYNTNDAQFGYNRTAGGETTNGIHPSRGIALEIRKRRRALDLSQTQLAKAVGVSLSAVVTWEKGTRSPQMAALKSLAIVLGCTTDELLKDDDNAAQPV